MSSSVRPYDLFLGWLFMGMGFLGAISTPHIVSVPFLVSVFYVFCGGFLVGQSE
jgi:uncharacterized membrane protein YbaN (DUF454 family)